MKKRKILRMALAVLCCLIPTVSMSAQNNNTTFSTAGWWQPAEPPFSPLVHDDGSITFRFHAPDARTVLLNFGEWDVVPQPMTKNKDGIWSITIPPVEPRTYQYTFTVDGVQMPDMKNPQVKAGTEVYGSIVEVHGKVPRYDAYQDVAHGETHILRYTTIAGQPRQLYVYVPAAYQDMPYEYFPTLYLRHGGGDAEYSWTRDGRVPYIMDNLIASGKAVPMFVVMTNGMTDGSWAGGSSVEGINSLGNELIEQVIPLIESRYRVRTNRSSRAIAGLSMGGGQAFVIGMNHLNLFSAIGEFSSGLLSDPNFDYAKYVPLVDLISTFQ